ncbi:spliceosome associated factor 3, U4/U6 recycling protein-like [Tachypleus tridentatus]|uniref:spliceosome associated factor 3, U4/U6 recycling protein-like n=1 Tax=Tachypleus tridentatus TaxID=6853 RepID=UPI003FD0A90D
MCSIEGVEVKDGIENVWHVFQWAVSAVGLHVTQGDIMWEVYRESDDTFLGTLQSINQINPYKDGCVQGAY